MKKELIMALLAIFFSMATDARPRSLQQMQAIAQKNWTELLAYSNTTFDPSDGNPGMR
ncbi:MAG: hypothetical protein II612_05640 [Prevotella sp.]|nr:hypothetical protein [Prevotella sp.]